jgi:hypothetical protein
MLIIAFTTLGFLIGNLIGLSAESTLVTVLPLLFAFGGGAAIAFLHKLKQGERRNASVAITALSLSCLIGVYTGIYITEHQIISTSEVKQARLSSIESRKYLRSININSVEQIDSKLKTGELSIKQAYEALYNLIQDMEES